MTLIDRLEAAETGSRQLDCDIQLLVGPNLVSRNGGVWGDLYPHRREEWSSYNIDAVADNWKIPAYTTSVDAALTLIPENGFWSITAAGDGKGFDAFVRSVPNNQPMNWTRAKTAPLALVIAALRAREKR